MAEATTGTFTQTPAALAFSTLYARVQNYIYSPSDADAATIAKEGINDAIKRLNTRRWSWLRTHADITSVAGETGREYTIQANFKSPRHMELLDSSARIVGALEYMDPKNFDFVFPNRTSASISHYTVFNVFANAMLTLSGPPSSAWVASYPTMRMRYYRRAPLLAADADLFVGPTEVEPFLVWHGRAVAAAHFTPEKIAFAQTQAEHWWSMIVRDDNLHDYADY